jgi:hypothetical protein
LRVFEGFDLRGRVNLYTFDSVMCLSDGVDGDFIIEEKRLRSEKIIWGGLMWSRFVEIKDHDWVFQ